MKNDGEIKSLSLLIHLQYMRRFDRHITNVLNCDEYFARIENNIDSIRSKVK